MKKTETDPVYGDLIKKIRQNLKNGSFDLAYQDVYKAVARDVERPEAFNLWAHITSCPAIS